MPDKKNSGEYGLTDLDKLAKLGTLFGFYFLVQAAGYAMGAQISSDFDAIKAVLFGFEHLSHILQPASGVAWPLTPFLGIFLLYYTLFLPSFLRDNKSPIAIQANRYFLAALITVILFAGFVALPGLQKCAEIQLDWMKEWSLAPVAVSLIYMVSFVLWYCAVYKFITSKLQRMLSEVTRHGPWAEFITALCISVILLVVYVGSEYDGTLDRMTGHVFWPVKNVETP